MNFNVFLFTMILLLGLPELAAAQFEAAFSEDEEKKGENTQKRTSLTMCNEYSDKVLLIATMKQSSTGKWKTSGWIRIDKGNCRVMFDNFVDKEFYYHQLVLDEKSVPNYISENIFSPVILEESSSGVTKLESGNLVGIIDRNANFEFSNPSKLRSAVEEVIFEKANITPGYRTKTRFRENTSFDLPGGYKGKPTNLVELKGKKINLSITGCNHTSSLIYFRMIADLYTYDTNYTERKYQRWKKIKAGECVVVWKEDGGHPEHDYGNHRWYAQSDMNENWQGADPSQVACPYNVAADGNDFKYTMCKTQIRTNAIPITVDSSHDERVIHIESEEYPFQTNPSAQVNPVSSMASSEPSPMIGLYYSDPKIGPFVYVKTFTGENALATCRSRRKPLEKSFPTRHYFCEKLKNGVRSKGSVTQDQLGASGESPKPKSPSFGAAYWLIQTSCPPSGCMYPGLKITSYGLGTSAQNKDDCWKDADTRNESSRKTGSGLSYSCSTD